MVEITQQQLIIGVINCVVYGAIVGAFFSYIIFGIWRIK